MKKRIFAVGILLGTALFLLAGRLFYIQIIGYRDLSQAAGIQQQISLEGANSRGLIYDRNGTPLVGNNQEYIFIIREEQFDGETMNALNELKAREIQNRGSGYRVFFSERYDKSIGQRLIRNSSAYILEAGRRYSKQQTAAHLLGYVNPQDQSGASGLELMCDEELSLLNKKISASADVRGNLLQGRGLVVSSAREDDSYVKKGIVTTLDAGLQGKIEEILKKSPKDGAVVVLKSGTGEIVASASTPGFDPSNINEYMESGSDELVNKVTQGEYPPGSIFKIVVAAAALEKGIEPESVWQCEGYEIVNGKRVNCKTGGEDGHGTITFQEAFAQSCNSAFIQITQKVGAEAVLDMAQRMGLGEEALSGYPDEKSGNLMTARQSAGAAIANLAIGQGETLMTPLQAARMTNIIASDGVDPGVHLVLEEGEVVAAAASVSVLDKETTEKLKKMMAQTIISGSGKTLSAETSMAAKTGSAESSMGGEDVVHGWITGFAPAEKPEYTITVFIEDGESGSGSAGPIFAQTAQYLSDSKSFEQPFSF